jgi:hypothetical protein
MSHCVSQEHILSIFTSLDNGLRGLLIDTNPRGFDRLPVTMKRYWNICIGGEMSFSELVKKSPPSWRIVAILSKAREFGTAIPRARKAISES